MRGRFQPPRPAWGPAAGRTFPRCGMRLLGCSRRLLRELRQYALGDVDLRSSVHRLLHDQVVLLGLGNDFDYLVDPLEQPRARLASAYFDILGVGSAHLLEL